MEDSKSHLVFVIVVVLALALSLLAVFEVSLTGGVTQNATNTITTQEQINSLRSSVNTLQAKVNNIDNNLENNEREISRLNGNLQTLNAQISQLTQQISSQENTVSTGLAGLQQNIYSTQSKINEVQKSRSKTTWIGLILLLLSITVGFYAYRKGLLGGNRITHKIMDYITGHIKTGKKYHHIKQSMQDAGWHEHDIKKAYTATIKRNYQLYKKKSPTKGPDKLKGLAIIGTVVILFAMITFFIFGTSTGQAYQVYGGVDDYEEGTGLDRNLAEGQCFPPKIRINNQCCDDRNQNGVCDNNEGFTEATIETFTGKIIVTPATFQDTVQTRSVSLTPTGFNPQQINAVRGDIIEFTNTLPKNARVIADEGCQFFDSSLIPTNGKITWTTSNPGSCSITIGIGATGEVCNDNKHCANARVCSDNQCKFIADLYRTTGCNEYCTIIRTKVSTFNNDPAGNSVKQDYTLRMGLGSYTASGALDWTIKPIPDFCKPSSAARIHQQSNTWRATIPIPFEIREFEDGDLVRTRVETINTNEEKMLTHRNLDLDEFKIKIEDVHLTCGGQSVFS
jgi:hypothetical protein